MPAQTATKATTMVGSDGWNLPADIKRLSETTRSVVPVGSTAERGTLAAQFPGGVLPIPTVISRTDIVGAPLEIWDGVTWTRIGAESIPWNSLGAWTTPNGVISRRWSGSTWVVNFIGHLVLSTATPFTLTTALATIGAAVPVGWRPSLANAYGTGAYSNNFATYQGPIVARVDTDGVLSVAAVTGSLSVVQNCQFFIDISWTY